jgi:branched-chain amino acid aminotransferase
MTLLKEMDIRIVEDTIPREILYISDEVFFTGSAAEVTPIRSVDKIMIGNGKRGPVTRKIQEAFFAYINGARDDTYGWLTFVA